jgi:hypothetical protein
VWERMFDNMDLNVYSTWMECKYNNQYSASWTNTLRAGFWSHYMCTFSEWSYQYILGASCFLNVEFLESSPVAFS